MTDKEMQDLQELRAMVSTMIQLAHSDASRAEITRSEMESAHYQGYYEAEAIGYKFTASRLVRVNDSLTSIIGEARNA